MKKSDVLDAMVILTGQAFFIMLLLAIGGHYEYIDWALVSLIACFIFMKGAYDSHKKYRKGYINRAIRERKLN